MSVYEAITPELYLKPKAHTNTGNEQKRVIHTPKKFPVNMESRVH